jgi:hypothetical protein
MRIAIDTRLANLWLCVLGSLFQMTIDVGDVAGQGPPQNTADQVQDPQVAEAKKLFDYFSALSTRFDAKLTTGQEVRSDGKSLLNWTITDSWHGSFFVWTSGGKPVLVGCLLSDSESPSHRRSFIELHSMNEVGFIPLSFSGIKKYVWNPDPKQCIPIPIQTEEGSATNPAPAASARLRRGQMRLIAESFSVTMFEETKKGNGVEQLRLLGSPLYRYPSEGEDGLEGAIFAFVTTRGTDPEFLLSVECEIKDGTRQWQIRPMRFCTRKLDLRQSDKIMWSVDEYNESGEFTKLQDPYMIITLLETTTDQFNDLRSRIQTTDTRLDQSK